MKKFFLILLMSVCAMCTMAQTPTVTNSSFENWGYGNMLTQEQPDGWTAALVGNVVTEVFGFEVPIPVSAYFGAKTTEAHSGDYALEVQPMTVGLTGTDYSYLFPGIVQYGTAQGFNIPLESVMGMVDIFSSIMSGDSSGIDWESIDFESLSTLMQVMAPGDALTQTPSHLNLWVQFRPLYDDQLFVIAYTKSGGLPVGSAIYTTTEYMSDYTLIQIPFDNAFEPCDSLAIMISIGSTSSNELSQLIIDDVTIDYEPDGVNAYDAQTFTLAPNPTNGTFFISPKEEGAYAYSVFDMQGRLICSESHCEGVASINTNNFFKGVYVVKVSQNGKEYPQKVVVR